MKLDKKNKYIIIYWTLAEIIFFYFFIININDKTHKIIFFLFVDIIIAT